MGEGIPLPSPAPTETVAQMGVLGAGNLSTNPRPVSYQLPDPEHLTSPSYTFVSCQMGVIVASKV